jgi:hypothetical protein
MSQPPKLQDHPWWNHLPEHKRHAARSRSRWRQRKERFSQRRNLIATTTLLYLLVCLIPLLFGASTVSVLALMPILLMPALLAMIWWLAWKEFHD